MTVSYPAEIGFVLSALTQAGFEACLVGGCVRDMCMGIPPHDYDITSSARPEQIKRVFAAHRQILNGEKHGTVAVVIDGNVVEITTYRLDGDYVDSRHPSSVTFTDSLVGDLSRRDFTVNAMAWNPERGLIDPFGGQLDIQNQIIRCVGEPEKRFEEDALRILRGLRFSARLGFTIESRTGQAMRVLKSHLSLISRERVQVELLGILQGACAGAILRDYADVIHAAVPELSAISSQTLNILDHLKERSPLYVLSAFLLGEPEPDAALSGLKLSNALRSGVLAVLAAYPDFLTVPVRVMLSRVSVSVFDVLCDLYAAQGVDVAALRAEKAFILDNNLCISLSQLALSGADLKAIGFSGPAIGREMSALLSFVVSGALPNDRAALLRQAQTDVGKK